MANSLDEIKQGHAEAPVEALLLKRWSPRAFADSPVTDTQLKSIFAAAGWAASSYNEQPWRFLVGRKGDESWQKIYDVLAPFNQAWAASAPVLFAAAAKKTFSHNQATNAVAVHDLGAACANASLQAAALGLYTHGMGAFDHEALRKVFAIPDDFTPVACWALGYLGDLSSVPDNFKTAETQPRVRKPLGEIVFERWGTPAW